MFARAVNLSLKFLDILLLKNLPKENSLAMSILGYFYTGIKSPHPVYLLAKV